MTAVAAGGERPLAGARRANHRRLSKPQRLGWGPVTFRAAEQVEHACRCQVRDWPCDQAVHNGIRLIDRAAVAATCED